MESEQCAVHSLHQTQLEKKIKIPHSPLLTPPTRNLKKKKRCHFTPQRTAWKFYFLKWVGHYFAPSVGSTLKIMLLLHGSFLRVLQEEEHYLFIFAFYMFLLLLLPSYTFPIKE